MKALYDSHMHLLTLGHPSFLSFLETLRHRGFEPLWSQIAAPNYLLRTLLFKGGETVRNILSVMENDVASILELMEDDLAGVFRKPGDPEPLLVDGTMRLGGREYDRLVLEPMLMDFQVDSLMGSKELYYDRAPAKPMAAQVDDILEGIREYRRRRPKGFLVVRPFLGVHPHHYDAEGLRTLLGRSFWGFRRSEAGHKEAWRASYRYSGDPDRPTRGAFAGVKVYPPLGFDPWPEDDADREKMRILYSFCSENRIPLATHCDDQGYRTIPLEDSFRFTSPERWRAALAEYPDLEVCFAHFGQQYIRGPGAPPLGQWMAEIVNLILDRRGVWTDFSFNGAEDGYYAVLKGTLDSLDKISRERVEKAVLFGTDFPLCLMKVRSYSDYWRIFAGSAFSERRKRLFAAENGAAFLFGTRNAAL